MQIMFYAQVVKPRKKDADFEHNSENYRFVNRNIKKAIDKTQCSHIDRIDNDYTGDSAPYYACVYFGWYDPMCFDYDEFHIEHDSSVLFAKKGYEDIDSDTIIVPKKTDMGELQEAYENRALCQIWLELCEILSENKMENAHIITSGNPVFFDKQQILELQKDCEWVDDFIKKCR